MDGADFVDLHAEVDDHGTQDNVTVSVPMDYMSEESFRDEGPGPQPPPGIEEEPLKDDDEPLTEEDIVNILKNV